MRKMVKFEGCIIRELNNGNPECTQYTQEQIDAIVDFLEYLFPIKILFEEWDTLDGEKLYIYQYL